MATAIPLLFWRMLGGASNVRDMLAPVVGPIPCSGCVPPYGGCGVLPNTGFGVLP